MEEKAHVLIIDDDEFLAGIYETKLALEGFDVSVATDGEEGLKRAAKRRPDVILLDILMPKMDGFEVLKQLKRLENVAEVPVIMLTNLGQKEDIEKALENGAADYLIKAHFVPADAVAKIRQILKM